MPCEHNDLYACTDCQLKDARTENEKLRETLNETRAIAVRRHKRLEAVDNLLDEQGACVMDDAAIEINMRARTLIKNKEIEEAVAIPYRDWGSVDVKHDIVPKKG